MQTHKLSKVLWATTQLKREKTKKWILEGYQHLNQLWCSRCSHYTDLCCGQQGFAYDYTLAALSVMPYSATCVSTQRDITTMKHTKEKTPDTLSTYIQMDSRWPISLPKGNFNIPPCRTYYMSCGCSWDYLYHVAASCYFHLGWPLLYRWHNSWACIINKTCLQICSFLTHSASSHTVCTHSRTTEAANIIWSITPICNILH